jgi:acyl-CoA thioester hydrolase
MANALPVHEDRVQPEWIDYNRHMRDAYYAVAFSEATDALMDYLGLDEAYREATKGTLYTLEMKLGFLREISEGEAFTVTAQLLDADAKRIHVFLRMHAGESGALVATHESVLLHVDQAAGPASAPFPDEIAGRVQALLGEHKALEFPEVASRPISLAKKKPASG